MPVKVNEALYQHDLTKENKILRFLDKRPKDEVYTQEELVKTTKLSDYFVQRAAKSPRLEHYKASITRVGTKTPKQFWGHPDAIEALKRLHKRATGAR